MVAAAPGHLLLLESPGATGRDPTAWRQFISSLPRGSLKVGLVRVHDELAYRGSIEAKPSSLARNAA